MEFHTRCIADWSNWWCWVENYTIQWNIYIYIFRFVNLSNRKVIHHVIKIIIIFFLRRHICWVKWLEILTSTDLLVFVLIHRKGKLSFKILLFPYRYVNNVLYLNKLLFRARLGLKSPSEIKSIRTSTRSSASYVDLFLDINEVGRV